MLKSVKQYEDELNEKISSSMFDTKYKWYHLGFQDCSVKNVDDCFNYTQFVSVVDNNVIGYFIASWERPENFVNSLSCINFGSNPHTFAVDLRRFLKHIKDSLGAQKIIFSTVVGNPSEENYDKLIMMAGGRIVGTFRRDVLIGNKYYDIKYYEWVNKCFVCTHCGNTTKKRNGIICQKCGLGEMVVDYQA
jgi:hypothetical protein